MSYNTWRQLIMAEFTQKKTDLHILRCGKLLEPLFLQLRPLS